MKGPCKKRSMLSIWYNAFLFQDNEDSWEKVLDSFQIFSSLQNSYNNEIPFTINVLPSNFFVRLIESQSSNKDFVSVSEFLFRSIEVGVKILNRIPEDLKVSINSVEAFHCIKHHSFASYGVPISSEIISAFTPIISQVSLNDFAIFFALRGSLKNKMHLKSIDFKIVDYGIELLLSTGHYWIDCVRNIWKHSRKKTKFSIDILFAAVLTAHENGDLNNIDFETIGLGKLDTLSGLIALCRVALDKLINENKWSFLTDRRDTPDAACDVNRKLTDVTNELWAGNIIPNSPSWLLSEQFQTPFESIKKLDTSIQMFIDKFNVSIYDNTSVSGDFGLESLTLSPKIQQLSNLNDLDSFDIVVHSTCPLTEVCISPSLISFLLDWSHRVKSHSPTYNTGIYKSNNDVPQWHDQISMAFYFDLGLFKLSVEERNAGFDFSIESFCSNILFRPTYNEWGSRMTIELTESCVTSFENLTFRLFDATTKHMNTHLLVILCKSSRTLIDYSRFQNILLATVVFDYLSVTLPRSLIAIQMFLERVRDDFPGYFSAFSSNTTPENIRKKERRLNAALSLVINNLSFKSELLKNFRFSYVLKDYILMIKRNAESDETHVITYQYQIKDQQLIFNTNLSLDPIFYPLPRSFSQGTTKFLKRNSLDIFDIYIEGVIVLEDWSTTINIEILDRIFTTYSVVSGELNDLIRLISYYSEQRKNEIRLNHKSINDVKQKWNIKAQLIVKDPIITGQSPGHELVLRSDILTGYIKLESYVVWGISGHGMDIRMSHSNSANISNVIASALIDIDLEQTVDEKNQPLYKMTSKRLYSSVHADSVDLVFDAISFWEKEIARRNQAREFDLKEMKENALMLLSSIKVGLGESSYRDSAIELELGHVCVGFIMADNQGAIWETSRRRKTVEVLMISFKDSKMNWLNNTSLWQIKDLHFMFVNSMDIGNLQQYDPDSHKSVNYASLPKVSLNITKNVSPQKDHSKIESKIDGLLVFIDGSFTEKIHKVYDIIESYGKYREESVKSKESRLRTLGKTMGKIESALTSQSQIYEGATMLQIEGKCYFAGLKLKVLSHSLGHLPPSQEQIDIISLPGLVLNFNGLSVLGARESGFRTEKGLFFDLSFEKSENLLKPEFFHFLRELSQKLQYDRQKSQINNLSLKKDSESHVLGEFDAGYTGRVNYKQLPVTVVLRLAPTRINLSCVPYSNVVCSINSDFALIVLSYVPKERMISGHHIINCTFSIQNFGMVLRHDFSPEDCVKADIDRINLNLTGDYESGLSIWSQVSVVKVSVILNIRQFQDFLIFHQIWVVNIQEKKRKSSPLIIVNNQELKSDRNASLFKDLQDIFAGCIVIPLIELTFDLGPSIGRMKITSVDIISSFEFLWKGDPLSRMIHFAVGKILIYCDGRFGGNIVFDSLRGLIDAVNPNRSSSGRLGVESTFSLQKFSIDIQNQFERLFILGFYSILIVDVKPVLIRIHDDWHENKLILRILIDLPHFSFCVSKQTVPRILEFIYRLGAAFKEKLILAHSLLSISSVPPIPEKNIIVFRDVPRQVLSISPSYGFIISEVNISASHCFGTLSGNWYLIINLASEILYVHR